MEVKQYTPLDNLKPQAHFRNVTVIATHALGWPKETYEPLFDELYRQLLDHSSIRIRSIWIADVATSAASATLNEGKLGNDPSYFDWARDLLLMVNHFRHDMIRPIVGLGHSMGATAMINTALFHPRLFTTVILVEPVLNRHYRGMNLKAARAISMKKDQWPSREAAITSVKRQPLMKTLDPRAVELFAQYGLRELPTLLYPEEPDATQKNAKPVTLSITRHHDVSAFARGAFPSQSQDLSHFEVDRTRHPDLSKTEHAVGGQPFYRPESVQTFAQLPFLRPSCLFIHGDQSPFSFAEPSARADKVAITGTGTGGSGGNAEGAVDEMVLEGCNHWVPLEKPSRVAEAAVRWLEHQLIRSEEGDKDPQWDARSIREKSMLDDDWLQWSERWFGAAQKRDQAQNELSGKTKL
ncbi:MAG: hypothetical protein Q9162_004346 [Coniocarpon cinnabarinum]